MIQKFWCFRIVRWCSSRISCQASEDWLCGEENELASANKHRKWTSGSNQQTTALICCFGWTCCSGIL